MAPSQTNRWRRQVHGYAAPKCRMRKASYIEYLPELSSTDHRGFRNTWIHGERMHARGGVVSKSSASLPHTIYQTEAPGQRAHSLRPSGILPNICLILMYPSLLQLFFLHPALHAYRFYPGSNAPLLQALPTVLALAKPTLRLESRSAAATLVHSSCV
ncbi:hypothetical protein PMIN06_007232 [Paraphaeosphaeria minitans]